MVRDAFYSNIGSDSDHEPMNLNQEQPAAAPNVYTLLNDADEPLWSGCKKYTILSAVSQLLNCKSEFNISVSCFNRIITIIKGMLPENDKLPSNYYQMKKKMEAFGLGYRKIDACVNNCMLFYKETENLEICACGHPRHKPSNSNGAKKVPFKVLRYFPLIPRLQRLFMSKKTAENMIWHSENKAPEGVLMHPSNGEAWHHFDSAHESFAADARNLRLGLCTDGFNPFKHGAKPYSCWPVMLVIYNLPPWMCMKQSSILLNMVIPGPTSPSQNIDIFLQPLIDELQTLWTGGVRTYDSYKKEHFFMRAALLWTISDFPAYGMLSGWSTHGKLSCPYCMSDVKSFTLQHGGKPCFFYCHRQHLPQDHPFRRQRDQFMKRVEHDPPITRLSGQDLLRNIDSIPDITFGTKCNVKKPLGYGITHHWAKKSIFWALPYWHTNLIRHNLDAMHVEKDAFDNVFNTMMDVKGKTKDNDKARKDVAIYCHRPALHLIERNGRLYKPTSKYVLSKVDQMKVCAWTKELKLPDGFVSNIGRCVNLTDGKFYGLKSHDCHVFMQRLLPIAFRDMVPDPIWHTVTELSDFFRDICATELTVSHMELLEASIVETLCKLEKIFPPGFFDSMEHVCMHLPYEAKVGGPVQYRWMYPFERFLHHLKKKVKNQACVEGSICEAYIVEEISSFCALYFEDDVETRSTQVVRNDDGGEGENIRQLSIFTYPGRPMSVKTKKRRTLTKEEYQSMEIYVLKNCDEVLPYIEIFDEMIKVRRPHTSDANLEKIRDAEFASWFKQYVASHYQEVNHEIAQLAHGPSNVVVCYNGYFVNGFKFHTVVHGRSRSTMNSGVSVKGSCYNDNDKDFYGILEDIIEVEYYGQGKKIVLFKCHWFDTTRGVRIDPRHNLVEVNYKSILGSDEPFVLAQQCHQVYYSPYPSTKKDRQNWWAVFKTKARGRYNIDSRHDDPDLNAGVFQDVQMSPRTNVGRLDELDDQVLVVPGDFEIITNEVRTLNEDDIVENLSESDEEGEGKEEDLMEEGFSDDDGV